ncbi:MAG: hypothetical protein IMZ50_09490 [Candidatus Atribacteria bacterium]|nr:hypothetical protein [Candidatus Atribacteria bacterium]
MAVLKGLLDPRKNHRSVAGTTYNQNRGVNWAGIKPHWRKHASQKQLQNTAYAVAAKHAMPNLPWNLLMYWQGYAHYFRIAWWDNYIRYYNGYQLFTAANIKRLSIGLPVEYNPTLAGFYDRITNFNVISIAGDIVCSWDLPPYETMLVEIFMEKRVGPGRARDIRRARLYAHFDADLSTCTIPGLAPGLYTIWWLGWQKQTGLWSFGEVRPDGKWAYWHYADVEVT